MKWTFFTILVVIAIIVAIFLSCRKEYSCEGCNGSNKPPIADAGPDQLITLPTDSVLLNGSGSNDPDGKIKGWRWTKISGPSSFSIANANAVQTNVTNLVEGTFLFQLKVTDAGGLFSMDTVQVILNKQTNNSLVDIYVAGQEHEVAKYWKNGQEVLLSSQSLNAVATSIAVVGNDIYVAGKEGDLFLSGNNKAKYWKNGQEVLLTGATGAGATSIAVAGGDVYVAGWDGYRTVAKYWKNGQPVSLTNGSTGSTWAEATCIVVVNGDIYVAGHENEIAKYWKNGQPVSLTHGSHAFANSIAVVGNDVYVAGSESGVAKYWKNGQSVSLTNGTENSYATSISVTGGDVYVAGYEGYHGNMVAKYWKNGMAVPLSSSVNNAYAYSIAIFGKDVYVAGIDAGVSLGWSAAKYWKNGQAIPLTGANGAWAFSILVVPH